MKRPRRPPPWYMFPSLSSIQWGQVSVGVLFVTFLCPAMSFYALLHLPLAVSMTLNSIGPLYSLFILFILNTMRSRRKNAETSEKGEAKSQSADQITRRAVLGTLLACCGVVPFYMA